ncbi:MAG: LuxR C-terminal-related transcriptional regulator [Bacillota bacterium]|nr:LuxR C-terminal-related transcriptional regulator [Bacillota bacterium]MDW7678665.1 LuxR C-terminal-related transcriptional regulator [Bacillota bacterium]
MRETMNEVVMMQEGTPFMEKLERMIHKAPDPVFFQWMAESVRSFFSTPEIPKYYQLLKTVDMSRCQPVMPRLMTAWMALLSGDHTGLFRLVEGIKEEELTIPSEQSFYFALQALIGYMLNPVEGLKDARRSVELMKGQPQDLFSANAQLTLGQLLTSNQHYREAAEAFDQAEKLFQHLDMPFPAVVALMNQMMNRYQLGEIEWVMDRCRETLLQSGRFRDEIPSYWKLLHLPLGMCYYQINRVHAALRYLSTARECIEEMQLFHLYGLAEVYLFKIHSLLGDRQSMEAIYQEEQKHYRRMHYEKQKGFHLLCAVMLTDESDDSRILPEIEEAEFLLQQQKTKCSPLLLEALTLLALRQKENNRRAMIDPELLEDHLRYIKYIGRVPQTQQVLVHLALLYEKRGLPHKSRQTMKEAVMIFQEHGCVAPFAHLMASDPQTTLVDSHVLRKMNLVIPEKGPIEPFLLTDREREVMQLIANGKTNQEIGQTLCDSVRSGVGKNMIKSQEEARLSMQQALSAAARNPW